MHQYSEAVNNALDERRYVHKAAISFADGTSITVGEDKIWQGGFEIDRAVSGQSSFEIGTCVIGEFKLLLNNAYGDFDDVSFYGASIVPQIEVLDTDLETVISTIKLGEFFVDEIDTNGTRVDLTCLDAMYKFDIPLSDITYPTNPNTGEQQFPWRMDQLMTCCCDAAGVTCGTTRAEIDAMAIEILYPGEASNRYQISYQDDSLKATSCRDAIGMLCINLGAYAYIDFDGKFRISQLNLDWLKETSSDPDYYAANYAGEYHSFDVTNMTKFNRDEENVTITGVRITDNDGTEYSGGSQGYEIAFDRNMIMNPWSVVIQNYATGLARVWGGATFRPFSISHMPDIRVEAGDPVLISDQRNKVYKSIILRTKYSARATQSTDCKADSEAAVNQARYSVTSKAIANLYSQRGKIGPFNFDYYESGNIRLPQFYSDWNIFQVGTTYYRTRVVIRTPMTYNNLSTASLFFEYQSSSDYSPSNPDNATWTTLASPFSVDSNGGADLSYLKVSSGEKIALNTTWGLDFYDARYASAAFSHYLGGLLQDYTNGLATLMLQGDGGLILDATSGRVECRGYAVDNCYLKGDTFSANRVMCSGAVAGTGRTMLAFFIPVSRAIKWDPTCTCTDLSVLVRTSDGVPYARSGSSGGTYTQLGTNYISIWSGSASVRTNEVTGIACTTNENGLYVVVTFAYGLAKASGSTTLITANVPASISIRGTFVFG